MAGLATTTTEAVRAASEMGKETVSSVLKADTVQVRGGSSLSLCLRLCLSTYSLSHTLTPVLPFGIISLSVNESLCKLFMFSNFLLISISQANGLYLISFFSTFKSQWFVFIMEISHGRVAEQSVSAHVTLPLAFCCKCSSKNSFLLLNIKKKIVIIQTTPCTYYKINRT